MGGRKTGFPAAIAAFACGLCLSACSGEGAHRHRGAAFRQPAPDGLINPLLDLETDIEFRELRSFRAGLLELVESLSSGGGADHVSVYFRDLNNGPSFGIGEKEKFSLASLLKLPVLVAILRQAEDAPGLLAQRIADDAPVDPMAQNIAPSSRLAAGRTYSVEELLRLMIVHSDNRAQSLLVSYLDDKVFRKVFSDLGLGTFDPGGRDVQMSVKEYARFFRILYNASYLNRSMSKKALGYLAQTEYKDGLAAGLPPGVVLAHKFGERAYANKDGKQLHDCGIVYHPRTPYVLCVMTRGASFPGLASVIARVSSFVYRRVEAH